MNGSQKAALCPTDVRCHTSVAGVVLHSVSDALSEIRDVSVDAAFVLDRAGDTLAEAGSCIVLLRRGLISPSHSVHALRSKPIHPCLGYLDCRGCAKVPVVGALMCGTMMYYASLASATSRYKGWQLRPSSWRRSSPFRGNASAACRPLSRSTLQESRTFLCQEQLSPFSQMWLRSLHTTRQLPAVRSCEQAPAHGGTGTEAQRLTRRESLKAASTTASR